MAPGPWQYPEIPALETLDPDDPERWSYLSISQAAQHAHVTPVALHKWLADGWIKQPEEAEKLKYDMWKWDLHALYKMYHLGKKGRHRKFGNPGRRRVLIDNALRLKETGWPPGAWEPLSYNAVSELLDIPTTTFQKIIEQQYLIEGIDWKLIPNPYNPDGAYLRSFNLDNLVEVVEEWKHASRKVKRRKSPKRTKRERSLDMVTEFEDGYVEPSQRQSPVVNKRILSIQRKSERQTARFLGAGRANKRKAGNKTKTTITPAKNPDGDM